MLINKQSKIKNHKQIFIKTHLLKITIQYLKITKYCKALTFNHYSKFIIKWIILTRY